MALVLGLVLHLHKVVHWLTPNSEHTYTTNFQQCTSRDENERKINIRGKGVTVSRSKVAAEKCWTSQWLGIRPVHVCATRDGATQICGRRRKGYKLSHADAQSSAQRL